MKKIFCILFVILILFIPFLSISAYATENADLLEYALEWLIDTSIDIGDGTNGIGTDLINYYNSPEGQLFLTYLRTHPAFNQIGNLLNGYVQDANGAWYHVAELKEDHIDSLFETLNDYWSSGSAPIRNVTLSSLGINTYGYNVSFCGNVTVGEYGIIGNNLSNDVNTLNSGYSGFVSTPTIFVYSGSSSFPPVITTGAYTTIDISGLSNCTGQFVVLNTVGDSFYLYNHGLDSSLRFYFLYDGQDRFQAKRGNSRFEPQLYSNGVKTNEYTDFTSSEALDLFTKAIGLHICEDVENPVSKPDNVPYDDDTGNTIVLVPITIPGQPTYIAPNVFNNYLANNTYTYYTEGDTITNNVVNETTVNNFYNVYNNYNSGTDTESGGSSYDDTNLLNRLAYYFGSIISKLDEIINKLPPSSNNTVSTSDTDIISDTDTDINTDTDVETPDPPTYSTWLPPWLSWLDPDPCYDKFTDCIFNNIPILSLARNTLNDLNSGLLSQNESSVPASSGSSDNITFNGITANNIDHYIDYNHYINPHLSKIRPVTAIVAYSLGVISVWKSIKSIFGININISDFK